ncbi:hypothetical protein HK405_001263, partial [Cladochytrium tenue]
MAGDPGSEEDERRRGQLQLWRRRDAGLRVLALVIAHQQGSGGGGAPPASALWVALVSAFGGPAVDQFNTGLLGHLPVPPARHPPSEASPPPPPCPPTLTPPRSSSSSTLSAAASTAAMLPTEVAEQIFVLLDQSSLAQCVAACRTWRTVAIGVLYRTPRLGSVCAIDRFLWTVEGGVAGGCSSVGQAAEAAAMVRRIVFCPQ